METRLKARAKINLALDVIRKRKDGYHDLQMIMQTLELCDTVYIKQINKPRIKLETSLTWLPTDERNLVYRAVKIMMETYDIKGGFYIYLKKNIPVSAGLAGGSSDCAAALIGVRNLCRLSISDTELADIGKRLGADVPYCLMRGTVLAEGVGDKLKRLPKHPKVYVLLAKPPISVSTVTVFKRFSMEQVTQKPDIEKMISYLHKPAQIEPLAASLCNVLESVTCKEYPVITHIKENMMKNGALGAIMSGSGPTVFGYFRTRKEGQRAQAEIMKAFPNITEVYLTAIFNVKD